jgi:hypothetical protein
MGWLVVVAFEHLAENFSGDANIELFKGELFFPIDQHFRWNAVHDRLDFFCMGFNESLPGHACSMAFFRARCRGYSILGDTIGHRKTLKHDLCYK